jgi:hypothetical protein
MRIRIVTLGFCLAAWTISVPVSRADSLQDVGTVQGAISNGIVSQIPPFVSNSPQRKTGRIWETIRIGRLELRRTDNPNWESELPIRLDPMDTLQAALRLAPKPAVSFAIHWRER